ncbi:hypothetical protein SS05631_b51590 (plasmid) [Sinorhizobium sp. CCBAU 05631]|nr:hypothetical protein SS05631_b51590 [Sinorhizobium sp. CCBAU 05631]
MTEYSDLKLEDFVPLPVSMSGETLTLRLYERCHKLNLDAAMAARREMVEFI